MPDEARAKAVEAAALALCDAQLGVGVWASLWDNQRVKWRANAETQITAYLATMAQAGWVMVRDVEVKTERQWIAGPLSLREASVQDLGRDDGWNACRAAMLKGAGDEQG